MFGLKLVMLILVFGTISMIGVKISNRYVRKSH